MILGIYRNYTKELIIRDEAPTVESLTETYKNYKPEGVKDFLVTTYLHRFALAKVKSGFIDGPGIYRMTITVKFPMMFWHNIHTKIVKL